MKIPFINIKQSKCDIILYNMFDIENIQKIPNYIINNFDHVFICALQWGYHALILPAYIFHQNSSALTIASCNNSNRMPKIKYMEKR